jgi:hypothetical protein
MRRLPVWQFLIVAIAENTSHSQKKCRDIRLVFKLEIPPVLKVSRMMMDSGEASI